MAVLAGVAPAAAAPDALSALNGATAEGHIVPRYAALARGTAALAESARAFCAAPAAAGLERVVADYSAAALAWQGVQHIRFGPATLFRRYERFAFWPDPRNVVGRQLGELIERRDAATLAPEAFVHGSVAVQGLPALERLLFGDDARRLLVADDVGRFRCRTVVAIAGNLADMAAGTLRDWSAGDPSFARVFRDAGTATYRTPKEATLELFKALHGVVEVVADRKLARPLGASAQEARPRLAEAWRSDASLAYVQANLAAAADLFGVSGGMADYLRAHGEAALAGQIVAAFAAVRAAAAAVPLPLEVAVADAQARPAAEALARDVAGLKALLVERLAPALGIPVGFNSLDGD